MNFLKAYHRFTRHRYYSLFLALPLFIMYESGIIWVHHNARFSARNLVDVIIKKFISYFDSSGFFACSVFAFLLVILIIRPKQDVLLFRASYFLLMVFESFMLALILAFTAQKSSMFFLSVSIIKSDTVANIILSLGAGIYEELFFRVVLFGSLVYFLKKIMNIPLFVSIVFSAMISSALFSLSHYGGSYGDQWSLYSFCYRFVSGIFFCLLYRARGFAVAAHTHALYDIFIALNLFK
ncbi:CPBP family intramembrane metalloprotease [bacterium]|nr:CPBP family intramembrane metalloprotease [bacterium]